MHKRAPCLLLLLILFLSARPVSAQGQTGPIYIVQAGDSLSSIAEFFSVNLTELMSANGITDPNQLDAGQQLVIPGLDGITGILNIEVINIGDSFRSLVRRTQVPQAMFKKLNHVISPSQFYVGVGMIVPAQEKVQNLNMRISTSAGESLLELAVKQNTDVWTVCKVRGMACPEMCYTHAAHLTLKLQPDFPLLSSVQKSATCPSNKVAQVLSLYKHKRALHSAAY
jgi:LysM repeat protein